MNKIVITDKGFLRDIVNAWFNLDPDSSTRTNQTIDQNVRSIVNCLLDDREFTTTEEAVNQAIAHACPAWAERLEKLLPERVSFEPGTEVYSINDWRSPRWLEKEVDLVGTIADDKDPGSGSDTVHVFVTKTSKPRDYPAYTVVRILKNALRPTKGHSYEIGDRSL